MTFAAGPTLAAAGFWQKVHLFFSTFPGHLVAAAAILAIAFLASWVVRLIIRRAVHHIVERVKTRNGVETTQALAVSPIASIRVVQRTRTLGTVLTNIANAAIAVVAIILAVNAVAPNVIGSLAILTAAIGAGLGFGAQNIVKDVLNGLFIVVEDQLGVGDVVDTGLATGVVEDVGIRVTQVRDVHGTLWYVRNGEMVRVGNMSQGWARAILDLAVPYDTDLETVQGRVLQLAQELAEEPEWRSRVIEQPELWGIQSISGDAIVLRLVVKTRTTAKDDVARELRRRVKVALDELGVRLPPLHSLVLLDPDATAAARKTAEGGK